MFLIFSSIGANEFVKIYLSIPIIKAEANHHMPAFELEPRYYVNRTMADLQNVFNETVKSTTLVTTSGWVHTNTGPYKSKFLIGEVVLLF